MRFLLSLAWRDLRASGRHLWIFVACLVLGVSLVAAGGGLYRQVADALRADARLLFGGDVEVESAQPLAPEMLTWMQAPDQGAATVSRLIELRTMLRSADGRAQLIELQSTDAAYPLYGEVTLAPAGSLDTTLALQKDVPADRLLITESGILTTADVQRMRDANIHAFLVGKAFMRAADPGVALDGLFATA